MVKLGLGLKNWLNAGLSFFYPEVCQYCGEERATAEEGFVGAGCLENIKWIKPPWCESCGSPFEGAITNSFVCSVCRESPHSFAYARAAAVSEGIVLEIIHRYKYQRSLWFEPFLAGLLVRQAAPTLRQERWDAIVPVPLHPSKESEREFNQAARLSKVLGKATALPLLTGVLRRVEPTRSQTRLSRSERAENVRRAFRVRHPEACQGKRLVLVDDVLTTGATTNACARVLKEAGAAEVCVWTVARGVLN